MNESRRFPLATRACCVMLLLAACGRGGPLDPGIGNPPSGPTAQAWITTSTRARLLSQEPDLPIRAISDNAAVVIDVDEARLYQGMVGFGGAMAGGSG